MGTANVVMARCSTTVEAEELLPECYHRYGKCALFEAERKTVSDAGSTDAPLRNTLIQIQCLFYGGL